MGMDGLYRPSQSLGYTDSLGHLNASERAAQESRQVNKVNQHGKIDSVEKDAKEKEEGKKQQSPPKKDTAFEEELMDVLKSRFDIVFKDNVVYRFIYNEDSDQIELVDTSNQKILLTLTPDEFIRMTESMRHNSGIMTDFSA